MRTADIEHAFELLFRPYPADGVMRGRKDERAHIVFHDVAAKFVEIHGVKAIALDKVTHHKRSAVVFYRVEEGIIHGSEHDDSIARVGHDLNEPVEGGHHARRKADVLPRDRVAVARLFPGNKGVIVAFGHFIISLCAHVKVIPLRFKHAGGNLEIHVRNPHGLQIRLAEHGFQVVPLCAIGIAPVNKDDRFAHTSTLLLCYTDGITSIIQFKRKCEMRGCKRKAMSRAHRLLLRLPKSIVFNEPLLVNCLFASIYLLDSNGYTCDSFTKTY